MKLKYLLAFFPMLSMGQEADVLKLPDQVPPSPTVANLMRFEEVPVDMYTGQADISVPLYSKQIDKNLNFNLALRYNSLGVKVSESSGWTGTGWSLVTGGVISRTVRVAADEHDRFGNYKYIGALRNPDFVNYENLSLYKQNEFRWRSHGTSQYIYDTQLDIFQFSLLGMNGRFVIDPATHEAVVLSQDQRFEISIDFDENDFDSDNNEYEMLSFTITDANGYRYIFGDTSNPPSFWETSETIEGTKFIKYQGQGTQEIQFSNIQVPETVTAWHLKSIQNSNGVELATFNYSSSTEKFSYGPTITTNTLYRSPPTSYTNELKNEINRRSYFRPARITQEPRQITQTKKVSNILFRDGTEFVFTPTSQGSHPENDGVYLEKIQVYLRGTQEREFNFNYSITDENNRLWLDYITTESQKFSFSYLLRETVPDNKEEPDPWGFIDPTVYHGGISSPYDFLAYKRGLLSSIEYPTGGQKVFIYEPNTFSYQGADQVTNTALNPHNTVSDGYNHFFEASQSGIVSGGTFTLTHDQDVAVQVSDLSENFIILFEGNNNYDASFRIDSTSYGKVSLEAGTYTVSAFPDPNKVTNPLIEEDFTVWVNFRRAKNPTDDDYQHYLLGGGARIAAIEFHDPADGTNSLKRKINYQYEFDLGPSLLNDVRWTSSGSVDAQIGNMYKVYDVTDHRYLYNNDDRFLTHGPVALQYTVKTKEPNMKMSKGGYVGYKKVRVYDSDGSTLNPGELPAKGYTEYEYTNAQDFPLPAICYEYPYPLGPDLDYKRGLLLKQTTYEINNNTARVVSETINDINDYHPVEGPLLKSWEVTTTDCEWALFYNKYDNFSILLPENPMLCIANDEYGLDTPCMTHSNCGTFQDPLAIEEEQTGAIAPYYFYDQKIRPARMELQESLTREYFYEGIDTLVTEKKSRFSYNQQNYQLAEKIDYIIENGIEHQYKTAYQYPIGGYTTGLFTQAERLAIDNVVVDRNIVNTPIVVSSYRDDELLSRIIRKYGVTFPTGGNILGIKEIEAAKGNNAPEDRVLFQDYDTSGNVVKASKPEGMPVQYIYGYDNTLPVAKIEGEVNLAGVQAIIDNIKLYSSAANYSEANLKAALESLRGSFSSVLVTTLTHKPGIGVTSVTDPRGRTVTYEYDELGRLTMVKDHDGNLVSENFYNFRTLFP